VATRALEAMLRPMLRRDPGMTAAEAARRLVANGLEPEAEDRARRLVARLRRELAAPAVTVGCCRSGCEIESGRSKR